MIKQREQEACGEVGQSTVGEKTFEERRAQQNKEAKGATRKLQAEGGASLNKMIFFSQGPAGQMTMIANGDHDGIPSSSTAQTHSFHDHGADVARLIAIDQEQERSLHQAGLEAQLEELMRTARIAPAVNQIERHPKLPQDALVRYCQERGIVVTAYSPLARGGALFADPVVSDIAEKHSVAPAQVLLRWSVQRGVVVVPKSVTPSRIEANAGLWGFELDASDVEALSTLEDGESVVASPWGTKQKKNVVLRPLLTAIMWPVSKIVRVDVQRMGRSGFWRWAWSEGE